MVFNIPIKNISLSSRSGLTLSGLESKTFYLRRKNYQLSYRSAGGMVDRMVFYDQSQEYLTFIETPPAVSEMAELFIFAVL